MLTTQPAVTRRKPKERKSLSAPVCYPLLIGIRSLNEGRDDDPGTRMEYDDVKQQPPLIMPFHLPSAAAAEMPF